MYYLLCNTWCEIVSTPCLLAIRWCERGVIINFVECGLFSGEQARLLVVCLLCICRISVGCTWLGIVFFDYFVVFFVSFYFLQLFGLRELAIFAISRRESEVGEELTDLWLWVSLRKVGKSSIERALNIKMLSRFIRSVIEQFVYNGSHIIYLALRT